MELLTKTKAISLGYDSNKSDSMVRRMAVIINDRVYIPVKPIKEKRPYTRSDSDSIEARNINALYDFVNGVKISEISKSYGVSQTRVRQYCMKASKLLTGNYADGLNSIKSSLTEIKSELDKYTNSAK